MMDKLKKALAVIYTTEHIYQYLKTHDPKALAQVEQALKSDQINPETDETIICKACDAPADVFLAGLYPFCIVHGAQVRRLAKVKRDLFAAMYEVMGLTN